MARLHIRFALLVLAMHVLYSLVQYSNASCLSGLTDIGDNVCVLKLAKSVNFCEAHETCEQEGLKRGLRLFIPGVHAPQIARYFKNSSIFFTSITALLNRSSALRAGWQVGDPGHADFMSTASDSSIPWNDWEPNYFGSAIAEYYYELLHDSSSSGQISTHVICELSTGPVDGTGDRFKLDWPYRMDSMFLTDDNTSGCFVSTHVTTVLTCTRRCKLLPVCRSFYFNKAEGYCWLALYVDSLLPKHLSSQGGSWLRFGRPDW